ncbi:helix-turn-helix domain-containing protein [Pararhizobium sp. DWP3-4]|uniref:helix-turn-helix domain-containing protein n=1 Tax=unclassified Pararhizobium TaxID=2643050 RepID=UPI003CFAE2F8
MTMSISNLKAFSPAKTVQGEAGQIVRRAREALGYSVDDLAETCGLTTQEIDTIELGADADPVRLRRVAAALQIDQSIFE